MNMLANINLNVKREDFDNLVMEYSAAYEDYCLRPLENEPDVNSNDVLYDKFYDAQEKLLNTASPDMFCLLAKMEILTRDGEASTINNKHAISIRNDLRKLNGVDCGTMFNPKIWLNAWQESGGKAYIENGKLHIDESNVTSNQMMDLIADAKGNKQLKAYLISRDFYNCYANYGQLTHDLENFTTANLNPAYALRDAAIVNHGEQSDEAKELQDKILQIEEEMDDMRSSINDEALKLLSLVAPDNRAVKIKYEVIEREQLANDLSQNIWAMLKADATQ